MKLLVTVISVMVMTAATEAANPESCSNVREGVKLSFNKEDVIYNFPYTNHQDECVSLCQIIPGCNAWNYYTNDKSCTTLTKHSGSGQMEGVNSGLTPSCNVSFPGDSCTAGASVCIPGSYCDNTKKLCVCPDNTHPMKVNGYCGKEVSLPGESCAADVYCHKGQPGSECDRWKKTCLCRDRTFIMKNGQCGIKEKCFHIRRDVEFTYQPEDVIEQKSSLKEEECSGLCGTTPGCQAWIYDYNIGSTDEQKSCTILKFTGDYGSRSRHGFYSGRSLRCSVSYPGYPWSPCSAEGNGCIPGSYCDSEKKICVCPEGTHPMDDGTMEVSGNCGKEVSLPGESCAASKYCDKGSPGSFCHHAENICMCPSGTSIMKNGLCGKKETCYHVRKDVEMIYKPEDVIEQKSYPTQEECVSLCQNTPGCQAWNFFTGSTGSNDKRKSCTILKSLLGGYLTRQMDGVNCGQERVCRSSYPGAQCGVEGKGCIEGSYCDTAKKICVCPDGTHPMDNGTIYVNGLCGKEVSLPGESCAATKYCEKGYPGSYCHFANNICMCPRGTSLMENGQCGIKASLPGKSCTNSDSCDKGSPGSFCHHAENICMCPAGTSIMENGLCGKKETCYHVRKDVELIYKPEDVIEQKSYPTQEECVSLCQNTPGCQAWNFFTGSAGSNDKRKSCTILKSLLGGYWTRQMDGVNCGQERVCRASYPGAQCGVEGKVCIPGSYCDTTKKICVCPDGTHPMDDGTIYVNGLCGKEVSLPGESCAATKYCDKGSPGSFCHHAENICMCPSGTSIMKNGLCGKKVSLPGERCAASVYCDKAYRGSYCDRLTNICMCPDGTAIMKNGLCGNEVSKPGERCAATIYCQKGSSGSYCDRVTNVCMCLGGYSLMENGLCVKKGKCLIKNTSYRKFSPLKLVKNVGSPRKCLKRCRTTKGCMHWTYVAPNLGRLGGKRLNKKERNEKKKLKKEKNRKFCYLKRSSKGKQIIRGIRWYTSGDRYC